MQNKNAFLNERSEPIEDSLDDGKEKKIWSSSAKNVSTVCVCIMNDTRNDAVNKNNNEVE